MAWKEPRRQRRHVHRQGRPLFIGQLPGFQLVPMPSLAVAVNPVTQWRRRQSLLFVRPDMS